MCWVSNFLLKAKVTQKKETKPNHIDPSSYLPARENPTPNSSTWLQSAKAHKTQHEAFVF